MKGMQQAHVGGHMKVGGICNITQEHIISVSLFSKGIIHGSPSPHTAKGVEPTVMWSAPHPDAALGPVFTAQTNDTSVHVGLHCPSVGHVVIPLLRLRKTYCTSLVWKPS